MTAAALALFEATGERDYLDQAIVWQTALDRHYANAGPAPIISPPTMPRGWWCGQPRPPTTRSRTERHHRPEPDPAGRLYRRALVPDKADRLIDGCAGAGRRQPVRACGAAQRHRHAAQPRRDRGDRAEGAGPLLEAALALPHLNRAVLRAPSADSLPASHPAQGKSRRHPGPAAFICIGETCSLPVTSPDAIAQAYDAARGVA